jgi:hypothetical protein
MPPSIGMKPPVETVAKPRQTASKAGTPARMRSAMHAIVVAEYRFAIDLAVPKER